MTDECCKREELGWLSSVDDIRVEQVEGLRQEACGLCDRVSASFTEEDRAVMQQILLALEYMVWLVRTNRYRLGLDS